MYKNLTQYDVKDKWRHEGEQTINWFLEGLSDL